MKHEQHRPTFAALPRTNSCKNSKKIIPSNNNNNNYQRSTSSIYYDTSEDFSDKSLIRKGGGGTPVELQRLAKPRSGGGVSALLRSLLSIISFPTILPACRWLHLPAQLSLAAPPLGRKVTGTLFGHRRGHVTFAVQDDSRAEPALLIELAVSTSALVKEMSSGLVRIALECEKAAPRAEPSRRAKLFHEPVWTMYCNGRKCGYAQTRACSPSDWHVLTTVRSVSVGAGVIPVVEDGGVKSGGGGGGASEGELLYMRARFERVVGSRDSEAFYMMNPDGNGGPELSIFLLRI